MIPCLIKIVMLLIILLNGLFFPLLSGYTNNDELIPSNRKELLTIKPWKMTYLSIGTFSGPVDACNEDNIYTFGGLGNYEIKTGVTLCEAGEAETTSGTWAFKDNDAVLIIRANDETIDHQIVELTETSLKLTYNYPVVGVIEETYGH